MVFPISLQFERRLKAIIKSDNQQIILQYIAKSITLDKANNVIIEDLSVNYRGSTSMLRGSLFRSVDNGSFMLICKDDNYWLKYQINMRKLFLYTALMSIFMGGLALVNGGPWWVGIIMFLWLCGANWVTILIRHGSLATDVAVGIDELICGKTEPPYADKMTGKLKSWF